MTAKANGVAGFSSIWTSNRNGRPAYSKPSECEVNGTNLSKSLINCLGSTFQHSNKLRHVGLYTAEPSIRQEGSRIRFRRRGWSTPGKPYRKLEIHFSDFGTELFCRQKLPETRVRLPKLALPWP